MVDIYGPAQQASSQVVNTPRNGGNLSNGNSNLPTPGSMTQQVSSAAEQAANQAAANTQAQLQQQRAVQNGMAANGNSSIFNSSSLFGGSAPQATGFLADHPKIDNFVDQAEDTAQMAWNFFTSTPEGLGLEVVSAALLKAGIAVKATVTSKWAMGVFSTIRSDEACLEDGMESASSHYLMP